MDQKDQGLSEETLFQTGQEVRVLICGGREMIFPESCISAVMELNDSRSAKYLQEGSVCLRDFGSFWSDLSNSYYGNFRFQMSYKDQESDWFDWLYIDENTMQNAAERNGLDFELLHQDQSHYLACLKIR